MPDSVRPEGFPDDAEFLSAFRSGTLPLAGFDHRAHVRAGYLYVTRHGLGLAIARFGRDLRAFAAAHGKHGLYHETITVAFLALINERIALGAESGGGDRGWDSFAETNPDLFGRDSLAPFYAPEELAAPAARRVFLLPRRRGTKQNRTSRRGEKARVDAAF
jgi:hypothetical protein